MTKVLAIIPARAGSKGIPGKNVHPILGHPLLAWSIAAGKLAPGVDRVILSTDSEQMAAIGRAYGAEVPFLRPAALAQDRSPDRDFLLHALAWLEAHGQPVPELVVHLRPTTPLRDPAHVGEALRRFMAAPEAHSLRSAHDAGVCPFKWFKLRPDSYYDSIASEIPIGLTNAPRQSFPTVYNPNGYVDVLRTSYLRAHDTIHGDRIMSYVTPPCHDIDTPADLAALERDPAATGSPLLSYLNARGKHG